MPASPFSPHIFIELLLCVRHYSKWQVYKREQNVLLTKVSFPKYQKLLNSHLLNKVDSDLPTEHYIVLPSYYIPPSSSHLSPNILLSFSFLILIFFHSICHFLISVATHLLGA